MGGGSCGPGAHPVHLWPPHFALSDHHPWDLGPHSGPALVRMRWGRWGERQQPVPSFESCLTPAWLCGRLLLMCFCGWFVFFLSCLLGLVPVFVWVLHSLVMDSGEDGITALLALPPLISIFIFIFPFLFPLLPALPPSKRCMEGCSPRSSLNLFSFSLFLCICVWLCLFSQSQSCSFCPHPPAPHFLSLKAGRWGRTWS